MLLIFKILLVGAENFLPYSHREKCTNHCNEIIFSLIDIGLGISISKDEIQNDIQLSIYTIVYGNTHQ